MTNAEAHAIIDSLSNDLPWQAAATPSAPAAPKRRCATKQAQALREQADNDTGAPGRFADDAALLKFVLGGNATLTMKSKRTGDRFTFRFTQPKDDGSGRTRPVWINVLNGSDNTSDYSFAGTIWQRPTHFEFRTSPKSRISEQAPSVQAVKWFFKHATFGTLAQAMKQAEFWHEGRCGRCARKLTVPESIESGFGPECINHI
jgi:hypothetical protein